MIDYTKFSLPSESAQEGEWREGGRDTGGWGGGGGGAIFSSPEGKDTMRKGWWGGGREVDMIGGVCRGREGKKHGEVVRQT